MWTCHPTVRRRPTAKSWPDTGFNQCGMQKHDKAFIRLKAVITTEPVLKGPKWDGTPFVVHHGRLQRRLHRSTCATLQNHIT